MSIEIKIAPSDRVIFCGKTGSGKTYLSHLLLADHEPLYIMDPKASLSQWVDDPPWHVRIGRDLGLLPQPGRRRIVAPPLDEKEMIGWWDQQLKSCYDAGDCLIYIDELFGIVPPGRQTPAYLHACFTLGRERGIGVWSCTQRPKWIPKVALTESEHFFCFRLQLLSDRREMRSFMGPMVLEPPPDLHGFWYYNTSGEMEDPVYVADAHDLILNRG